MRDDDVLIEVPHGFDRPGDQWVNIDGRRTRTWSGQRRRLTSAALLTIFAVAVGGFFFVPGSDVLKPGDLSSPHSQILAGTITQQRCGACHAEASRSPMAWLTSSSHDPQKITQTDLCLDCHHQRIPRQTARSAHNLTASHRQELSAKIRDASLDPQPMKFASTSISQDDIACAVCHKEHHGGKASLIDLSDAQCQACHSRQYESFAKDHPDWDDWPYRRNASISFDHRSHAGTHFPKTQGGRVFDCKSCHPMGTSLPDPFFGSSDIVRTVSYEQACASCHDETLNVQQATSLDLLTMPMLPRNTVEGVSGWPDEAIGFADGRLSPLMRLLLRSDPEVKELLRVVGDQELGDLVAGCKLDESSLRPLAVAISELRKELAADGHQAIRRRLRQTGVADERLNPTIRPLPPQLLQSIEIHWDTELRRRFTKTESSATLSSGYGTENDAALLSDDLLVDGSLAESSTDAEALLADPLLSENDDLLLAADPLLDDPLMAGQTSESDEFTETHDASISSDNRSNPGGWYRDDTRLAILYVGSGHADPVYVSLMESLSALPNTDPEKRAFLRLPAVAACVECHPGSTRFPAVWKGEPANRGQLNSTKFSHRPHLNVSRLGDCRYCHEVAPADSEALTGVASLREFHDFLPLKKAACVACHTAAAAGDRCTQCHRYHMTAPISTPRIADGRGLPSEASGVNLK
ncbi:MAG: hypothetical protein AAF802_26770 [Planctomycetota bacterium]